VNKLMFFTGANLPQCARIRQGSLFIEGMIPISINVCLLRGLDREGGP
jgi:hypothetical protein